SRRRHTRFSRDWSSDVCSSDLASVQLVGVYLVFSSLIMPTLAVRQAPPRWQLPLAWGAGALAYTLGLCVSAMLDWPSGAVVVVAMALLCVLTAWLAPKK